MGNANTKKGEILELPINPSELRELSKSFQSLSATRKTIPMENLTEFWKESLDTHFFEYILNYFYRRSASGINWKGFSHFYAVFLGSGDITDKIELIFDIISRKENSQSICPLALKDFVTSVMKSFFKILVITSDKDYVSWNFSDCKLRLPDSNNIISDFITSEVQQASCTKEEGNAWLQNNPLFIKVLQTVVGHLYFRCNGLKSQHSFEKYRVLPFCENGKPSITYEDILDVNRVTFINFQLPSHLQNKWRFLFSTKIHGESFSTFIKHIINQGPCVIIVEDVRGGIFGGFAPESWKISPNFIGNDRSFLFKLEPDMKYYPSTGYNEHYQYLNLHQQTMPNGLGMGGQFDYWGLWIDSEFGIGQSVESCTTFKGYSMLSLNKDFRIKSLEVWGVGDQVKIDEAEVGVRSSALDGSNEDKVLLELSGKKMYSDGLREEETF